MGLGIGIGISPLVRTSSGTPAYTPTMTDYLTRLASEGGTLTDNEKTWLNAYTLNPDIGEFDRLWIHGLSNQIAARISLVNALTADLLTEVNSPTWTDYEGYNSNGTTSYLNSNFNPITNGVKFTTSSACHFIYSTTNIDELSNDSGQYITGITSILSRYAGVAHCAINQSLGSVVTWSNTDSRGLFLGLRSGSNRFDYKNGVQKASYSTAAVANSSSPFFILGRNDGSLAAPSTRKITVSGYGSGAIDQAQFYTDTQALGTLLGWAV